MRLPALAYGAQLPEFKPPPNPGMNKEAVFNMVGYNLSSACITGFCCWGVGSGSARENLDIEYQICIRGNDWKAALI